MKSIVIIDVQNGFIKPGYRDLPKQIRAHVDAEKYDHILFGVFTNHPESNFVKILDQHNLFTSPEIDIVPELADLATPKTTFQRTSYSLFKSDNFKHYLETNGITEFKVCGLVADSCVLATAFEGFDLGYAVTVLTSLMRTKENLEDPTEIIFKRNIGSVINE